MVCSSDWICDRILLWPNTALLCFTVSVRWISLIFVLFIRCSLHPRSWCSLCLFVYSPSRWLCHKGIINKYKKRSGFAIYKDTLYAGNIVSLTSVLETWCVLYSRAYTRGNTVFIPWWFPGYFYLKQLSKVLISYFYFPDRESLGMGPKFDFGILVDLHVLRSTESKKVVFTKCLSVVCPGQ